MKSLLKVLLGINAISLIHLVKGRPTRFIEACKRAFTASRRTTSVSLGAPHISLIDILANRKPIVRLSVASYEDGMLPGDQSMALLSILVAEAPREILEIGTYMGHTTRLIAENLETSNVHTVDLPEDFCANSDPEQRLPKDDLHLINRRIVGREFKGLRCSSRIRQHFADTASWNFAEAGHPTFFFIDGSHTYEYCKNDSEKCFALCGGRGVFLWHDCDDTHPGVVKLISEWRSQGRDIRLISGTSIAYLKTS